MAIYTASIFQPDHHHGTVIPICRSLPPQYRGKFDEENPLRWLLAPSKELLSWWKKQENRAIDFGWEFPSDEVIAQYTTIYREEIAASLPEIKAALETLNPSHDETWVCWEPAGEFCHRNLAIALVEKFRPDCHGGCDTESTNPAIVSPVAENQPVLAPTSSKTPNPPQSITSPLIGQINADLGVADLYRWFLGDFKLPSESFEVGSRQRVVAPEKWFPVVRDECDRSLRFLEGTEKKPSARHHTGALQVEIKILRDRFG